MISIHPAGDQGPGIAGEDLQVWPGGVFTTGSEEYDVCGICKRREASWINTGTTVSGVGGGSGELYVWISRGERVPPPCEICDDCVNICFASGGLEYAGTWDGQDQEKISPAARRELFALGARETVAAFWDIQRAEGPCERQFIVPTPPELMDRIHAFSLTMGKTTDVCKAGRAYGAAAIAFGQANGDPGFEGAAARFAEGAKMDEEEELLRALLREGFSL